MRFIIDDKHLIKWTWVKKLLRITLAQDVFDRRWSLDGGNDTDQNISLRSVADLCSGVALCGRPQPEHESVMPLLSLSMLNVLTHQNCILCQGNISRKWFASYLLFLHEHLIIMWSPMVNLSAVMTLTDIRLTSLLAKNIKEEYKLFFCC